MITFVSTIRIGLLTNGQPSCSLRSLTRVIGSSDKLIVLIALLLAPVASAWAQISPHNSKPEAPVDKSKLAKPAYTLRVNSDNVLSVSIASENAKLADIAAELSRRIKVPVALSPVMQKQTVTVNFADLLLEPAMQLLAPQVYIDYEVDAATASRPRPLGIFLYAYNEMPPAADAVVKAQSQSLLISGNTETDGTESDEEDPVHISYKNGNMSVKAKDQPLIDVVLDMAEEAGVQAEVPDKLTDTVSVDIKDRPLDQAFLAVSPDVRVFVRTDLFRATRTVLRIVVVAREEKP